MRWRLRTRTIRVPQSGMTNAATILPQWPDRDRVMLYQQPRVDLRAQLVTFNRRSVAVDPEYGHAPSRDRALELTTEH